MDELIKIDDEAKEQMDNAFYGGLDANENQQKMAEVHFEAWMRLLDSRVIDVPLKEDLSILLGDMYKNVQIEKMKKMLQKLTCVLQFISSVYLYNT